MPTQKQFAQLHAVYVSGAVMLMSAWCQAWGLPGYAVYRSRPVLRLVHGGRA